MINHSAMFISPELCDKQRRKKWASHSEIPPIRSIWSHNMVLMPHGNVVLFTCRKWYYLRWEISGAGKEFNNKIWNAKPRLIKVGSNTGKNENNEPPSMDGRKLNAVTARFRNISISSGFQMHSMEIYSFIWMISAVGILNLLNRNLRTGLMPIHLKTTDFSNRH